MKTRTTIVLNERTLMLAKLKAVLGNETLSQYIERLIQNDVKSDRRLREIIEKEWRRLG